MERNSPRSGFFRRYLGELPKVAAGLTTALVIFVASWIAFPALRTWLRPPLVPDYPIVCTVEAVPLGSNKRRVEVHIMNPTGQDLGLSDLRRRLTEALGDSGRSGRPEIFLRLTGGTLAGVGPDSVFNEKKGELEVKPTRQRDGVWIAIGSIGRISTLRALIDVEMPGSDQVSRATPINDVPFDLRNIGEACYTAT